MAGRSWQPLARLRPFAAYSHMQTMAVGALSLSLSHAPSDCGIERSSGLLLYAANTRP